jgi:uncharacterized protein
MRVWLRASLVIVFCSFASELSLSAEPTHESRPGVYRGYSEAKYSEWVKRSEYVAVRDGTRLAVDIYRPAVDGRAVDERFPVVWVHTPYRRAYVDASGRQVNAVEVNRLSELIRHGYVVAAVDTRGRGASFGARRGFQDRTEANDAYDMTEWFAKQPFSTGKIGVAGCSYLGGTTWHSATTLAPHLRAIAPGCTDFDKYGFVSRGGITAQFNTRPEDPGQDFGQGVLPVDGDADGKLAAQAIAGHAAGTPMAELWRGMPFRDDVSPLLGVPYWREASVATYAEQIERSKVGIFIWGNWLDEGSFEAVLAFNNLRNPRKLWMGIWPHCQVGDFPMSIELLRFFDRFLKDVDNGWDREPPIYFRTVNAQAGHEWSTAQQWPLPQARMQALHLAGIARTGAAGKLTLRKPSGNSSAPSSFDVNYSPQCKQRVDQAFMMWPCVVENHGLSFATPPLAADAHIAGHPLADLWISSSRTDADVFVYLEDIAPSGEIAIVTHGRLRASHRGEQAPPYGNFMGMPYHRGERRDAQALEPNEPARMRIDLLPTSTIVRQGHRLQLTIAGADPRQRSRSLQFDPPPTLSIYSGAAHASGLSLPVLGALEFETATPLPQVAGPVPVTAKSEPYAAADARGAPTAQNLSSLGYVEEEFFVSGHGKRYTYDEEFRRQLKARDIPYETRVLLRRPADLAKFSGVVHLENAHPVQGGHSGWSATRAYILRSGDAYVLLSSGEDALTRGGKVAPEREALRAQLAGTSRPLGSMAVLRKFDPERYARITWPEDDATRWDSIVQSAAWLKSTARSNPLHGRVRRIYAQGWSFTGSLLRTFINEGFHDAARLADGAPLIDGYLIGISSSTFVSGVVSLTTGSPTLPLGHAKRVTRAIDVPVIELMTENEAVTNTGPQAAEIDHGFGRHRLYEVPGLTHGDGLTSPDTLPTIAHQLASRGLPARDLTDACELERSDIPFGHLASAALANLDAWVAHDQAPPRAPRIELNELNAVVQDGAGNARGGVRTAQIEVPLARYAVPDASSPEPCRDRSGPFLKIRRQPFDAAQLRQTYGDAQAYLQRFERRVAELVSERWLLPEDAAKEIAAAQQRAQAAWGST